MGVKPAEACEGSWGSFLRLSGFRFHGLGFAVLGFGVSGFGFRVWGLGFSAELRAF